VTIGVYTYSFTLLQEFYLILKVLPEGLIMEAEKRKKQGETA
jgi:hypothetical protein